MRIVRRIIAALFLPIVILIPTAIAIVATIAFTPPGHALLARIATQWITRAVAGSVEIGAVDGNIWSHIGLHDVVVKDSTGAVILATSHLEASYVLPELLAHRLVFTDVQVDSLRLHLVRLRAGHWNYEQVFHLGQGPDNGKPPPQVALVGLRITNGFVQVDAPTTPEPPHRPVSRHGAAPSQPRIEQGGDGLVQVRTFDSLDATIRLLRISTPRRDPLLVDIANMQVVMSDPRLTITQLAGRITTVNDSLRFKFDSASLPSSRFIGSGLARWTHDTLVTDFTLDAPRVALRDLWWISPDLPDWRGHGHIVATSYGRLRSDYRLDNLALGDGSAQMTGRVTLQAERIRGLGMRDLDMQLARVPIDLLRPFVDTLPVSGALTGHLLADGFLDAFRLGGDLVFADALVPGAPTSHIRPDGVIHFGGADGAVFDHLRLNQSTIALSTVHHLVPSVLLTGALALAGELNGPWQNADFDGTAEHVAPSGAMSRMIGRARLDSRSNVLGLGLDADFDQLSFDALRSGYPDLPSRGGLTGHVIANGNLDSLDIDANLTGEIGSFTATGRIKVNTPNYGADSLVVVMQRLDLQAVTDTGMSTAINGRVAVQGVIDSGAPPRGRMNIALDRSRFGGATVDAVTGTVRADHGMVIVDTGTVTWNGGRVDAHGTLGWAAPDSGTLTLAATVASLTPFDSLVRAITGLRPDTLHPRPLEGKATASLLVHGSVDAPTITGTVDGTGLLIDDWHASLLHATLRADSLGARGLLIEARVDTAGEGAHVADKIHIIASGKPDSLHLAGGVEMIAANGTVGGTWIQTARATSVRLDSLSVNFPHQGWRLTRPARMSLANGQVTFADTLRLHSADGSGEVRVSGSTPGDVPGKLDASVQGLDLLDVFGVLQRDSTALDGWGALELHLAGTRESPTFDGSASIISPVIGQIHAPSVLATFDYASQRLRSNVSLWRTGEKVLDGKVSLPLDLALSSRAQRKLPGAIEISAIADSVDLLSLSALIPDVRDATGLFYLNMTGKGTWDAPSLTGIVSIKNGGMFVPSLNVRYAPISGQARFIGDSMVIDTLVVGGNAGQLSVKGGLRFAQLGQPTMDLRMNSREFLAIDAPGYLTVRATGDVRLSGPLMHPVLSGDDLTVTRSVIYFTDLITKDVVDLEDPSIAALIDTTALRRQGIGNEFSSRFLDSLRIDGLQVHIGSEVWLRSAEANIQLEGDLTVDKDRKVYGLTGLLNAPRGTYTVQFGPIGRDFTVDQGTVRYYGTPDLNPDLQIQAHYQVRTVDGDDFNVVTTITGSLLIPKVSFSAPGRELTELDVLSYVFFGQSEAHLTGSQQATDAGGTSLTLALGAFFSQLQHSLLRGGKFSTLTIRPGATAGALTSSSSFTQLAAGFQLGNRWFVTFDAGFCLGSSQSFQKRNFGASLDYRLTRDLRFQAAAEPVQTCISNRAADVFTTLNRYQLGGNLLWKRDY